MTNLFNHHESTPESECMSVTTPLAETGAVEVNRAEVNKRVKMLKRHH